MQPIPFQLLPWHTLSRERHAGVTGESFWRTMQFDGLRVRLVEYSAGYRADHWCQKGHIVHCLEGSFISEMEDGSQYALTAGMTYVVSDHLSSHCSVTQTGATLLIIDGTFLK
jgi:hypothetical protein